MEEVKSLSSLQNVWKSGTTFVVAVPLRVREVMNIEKGDLLEVVWVRIVKKNERETKIIKDNKKEEKKKVKTKSFENNLPNLDEE